MNKNFMKKDDPVAHVVTVLWCSRGRTRGARVRAATRPAAYATVSVFCLGF